MKPAFRLEEPSTHCLAVRLGIFRRLLRWAAKCIITKRTIPMPFDGTSYETVSPVTHILMDGKQQLQRGWCQRIMRQRGSVCIIGSLAVVDYDVFAEAQKFLLAAIGEYGYSY